MNKAITDGVLLTPPPFANGLDVWSSGDGTPGSDTYANNPDAALIPADQDFGGALELIKTSATQRLRSMGETPLLPGCYLQIRARVKAISGPLPNVRIAAWAGRAGGQHLNGVVETGPLVSLTTHGEVVEVSAIVSTADRTGVDMPWGAQALYGHFGLDLTGPNGGVVRIDDIEIEDISNVFFRDIINVVDVRDYGAIGDGVFNNASAFEAADAAANGRDVLIPSGVYRVNDSVTFQSAVRSVGTVTMPENRIMSLTKNFDLPAYIDMFGSEELAFKKAYQSLLNNSGHESLDLGGRVIGITEPINIQAAVANKTVFSTRRVVRNGQFSVVPGPNWDTDVFTSQATYTLNNNRKLTNVTNAANIPVGSLVEGNGVGREVYVRAVNVGAQEITLSQPLFDAAGTQNYTFRRFKYMLDFTGFERLSRMSFQNVDFQCLGECSAIILGDTGTGFNVQDCFFTRPKNRGISSPGDGDQGLLIDRCQFLSDESPIRADQRVSIGFNANGNDIKVRNCRVVHFLHFAVVAGSSSIILGNHVFQGDGGPVGPRTAGFIMTRTNNRGTITGNYICDCSVEWSNEHDSEPDFSSEFSFSSLSITGNVFLSQSTAAFFNFIRVKPHGPGHFINGLMVTGNTVRLIGGNINKIEGIDTSFATMDFNRFRNITFAGNAFHGVNIPTENPLVMKHEQNSAAENWVIGPLAKLPFGANIQVVESVIPDGRIQTGSGATHTGMPYFNPRQGTNNNQVHVRWGTAVRGDIIVRLRIDDLL